MTIETYIFVATTSFFAMVSPGPDFFMVLKNSLSYPRKTALVTCLGVILAILTHMTYCVAGIAIIIKATPWLFNLLRYAGAAYLIWLGVKAWISKSSGMAYVGSDQEKPNISYKKAFIQGYLCNLLNPKATLFFLAIFTQVLAVDSSLMDKLSVAGIIWLLALMWWPCVVYTFQAKIVQRRYFKMQLVIDKLLGVILIIVGFKVALGV